jgi:hypothetical protein
MEFNMMTINTIFEQRINLLHLILLFILLLVPVACGAEVATNDHTNIPPSDQADELEHNPQNTGESGHSTQEPEYNPHEPAIRTLDDTNGDGYLPHLSVSGQGICECGITQNLENGDIREWTIDELSEIITISGSFWNDWWYSLDSFDYSNLGDWGYEYETIYMELLPSSDFNNLNDIKEYLLQFYTMAWVDAMLYSEFPPFLEHDNTLYAHKARTGSTRTDWLAATHELIEQHACCTVIETTAIRMCFTRAGLGIDAYPHEVIYRFTFIDGRVSSVSRCPIWAAWAD